MTDEIVYRNPYGQEMLTVASNGMSWSYDINMRGQYNCLVIKALFIGNSCLSHSFKLK